VGKDQVVIRWGWLVKIARALSCEKRNWGASSSYLGGKKDEKRGKGRIRGEITGPGGILTFASLSCGALQMLDLTN